ncbi:MAG TPA: TonB family protein [Candidatus Eisenbacteria bacterium]
MALAAAAQVAGCGRSAPRRASPAALAVEVWSDTSRAVSFRVTPPPAARLWLTSVSPSPPAGIETPLPAAAAASPPPESLAPPGLEIDPGLKPPILRAPARLVLPAARARGSVELDVCVSETGAVTDARRAGGSADPSLVAAAIACARSMSFYPALRAGRPVAVWCRQRFDFPQR